MKLRTAGLAVAMVCAVLCTNLRAQEDSERTLGEIFKYLNHDLKSRVYSAPLLFVGEINAMGPVFHGVCKSAVNQTVDFAVKELLLGEFPDDTFHYGYPNCTLQPLPAPPFVLHAQVIVFCHHHNLCRWPVPATAERLEKVRMWMTQAKRPEDEAALAQLRRAIQKAGPLRAASDLIFEGEIVKIESVGHLACRIAVGRKVEINIVHSLFGDAASGSIVASYGSVNCPTPLPLSVREHAKVIVYCAMQMPMQSSCLTPVEASPEKLNEVKGWIAAAGKAPAPEKHSYEGF
jgi:hypothetical protein